MQSLQLQHLIQLLLIRLRLLLLLDCILLHLLQSLLIELDPLYLILPLPQLRLTDNPMEL